MHVGQAEVAALEAVRQPGVVEAEQVQDRRVQVVHLDRVCKEVDRPAAALVRDLKNRGLLDDTLVIWGGEFGRTVFGQGDINNPRVHGRDHHIKGFSLWLAGGGIRGGLTHGATDEFGYHAIADAVHVHDLHATMLHLLGIDHKRLTYRFQGRDFRLTDVHGEVVQLSLIHI